MSIKIVFRVKNPQIKAVQPARILISLYVIYILLPHTPLLNVVPFDVRLHVTSILMSAVCSLDFATTYTLPVVRIAIWVCCM